MPRRAIDELRPIAITPHFITHPEGSALIECGDTRVICTASVEERVPPWMNGKGRGWVTAEYDMLPRATGSRRDRDSKKGRINGRTQEIGRLIGRALRAVVDTSALGERMISVDCDVIQADGGTRTAAITGGYVALALAVKLLEGRGKVKGKVLRDHVAAISVGVLEEGTHLDLDYAMDSRAHVDMNVIMTGSGDLVEVQGTGEGHSFNRDELDTMLDLAQGSLAKLVQAQKQAIETPIADPLTVVRV